MAVTFLRRTNILPVLGAIMLSQLIHGESFAQRTSTKSQDFTPDITSEVYWDTHSICVVRITDLGIENGSRYLAYAVTMQISEARERAGKIKLDDLWFGEQFGRPSLQPNDELILFFAREGRSPVAGTPLDAEGRKKLEALRHIASLRARAENTAAIMAAVFDPNPIVSLYCLKYLLKHPPSGASAESISRLTNLREEEGRDAQVRILASQLASKLSGAPENSDAEYAWLATSLAKSTRGEWNEVQPFVARLLEFQEKRKELADLFVNLALDGGVRRSVRIAAYSAFDDPRLFHDDHPDAESQKIFQACTQMLKDRDSMMRAVGAALLYNLSMKVDPANKAKYTERAKSAVGSAVEVESDDVTRQQMSHYLKLLSN